MIPTLNMIEPVALRRAKLATTNDANDDVYFHAPAFVSNDYAYRLIEDVDQSAYFHFPALVHVEDGTPWPFGNLFLMAEVEKYPPTPSATLKKFAQTLVDIVSVLDDLDIDMFSFRKRKSLRPTYAYSQHLSEKALLEPDTLTTSNQHISRMQTVYRWARTNRNLIPDNEMWKETVKTKQIKGRHGFTFEKDYISTDLFIRSASSSTTRDPETKLRAYSQAEQIGLITTLLDIGNTEMTLGFLTALLAGPRLQTVFTMPRSAFQNKVDTEYLAVPTGSGTLSDTKRNSGNNIYFPKFLVELIFGYLASSRHKERDEKSKRAGQSDNYVYLTKTGRPYYARKNDQYRGEYKTDPVGGSVTAFVRQQLTPALREQGFNFNVRFHNLRATFANNLARNEITKFENGEISWTQVVMTVCERLGQRSLEVTENYLQDIKRTEIVAMTQDRWEASLEERIRRSFGGGSDAPNTATSELHKNR